MLAAHAAHMQPIYIPDEINICYNMIVSVKLLRARLLIHPIVFDQTAAAEDAIRPHDLFRVARPAPPSAMSLRPAVERFLEDGRFYTQWWCVEKGISTARAAATSPFVTDHDLLAVLVAPQDQSEGEGKRDVEDKVLGHDRLMR